MAESGENLSGTQEGRGGARSWEKQYKGSTRVEVREVTQRQGQQEEEGEGSKGLRALFLLTGSREIVPV